MIAVVDASVALKWFFQESDTDPALRLRERHLNGDLLLTAPDLLLYEVGNTLRFKRDFSTSGVQAALSDLLRIQLELVTRRPSVSCAMPSISAHRNKLTYYDSVYLAIAHDVGTQLITADQKLQDAAGTSITVTLLHEMEAL
jgi:predicted nucleic acid-binding protein